MRVNEDDCRRKQQIMGRVVALSIRDATIDRCQGVSAIYLVRIEMVRIESHAECPIRILSQLIDTPIIRAFGRGLFLSQAVRLELERRLWRTLPARARG
jgi:hypothetical protein